MSVPLLEATIPTRAEELTPEWLTAALRSRGVLKESRVIGYETEGLGEGEGFVGSLVRLDLELDREEVGAPATLIAKFPIAVDQNRMMGEMLGAYEREIRFYEELADQVPLSKPRCYFAAMDPSPLAGREEGALRFAESIPMWLVRFAIPLFRLAARRNPRRYVLLLEDLAPARVGDQLAGCDAGAAEAALRNVARLHAPFWQQPNLEQLFWVGAIDALPRFVHHMYRRSHHRFVEALGARLPDWFRRLAPWLNVNGMAVMQRLGRFPWTLLHGDYRLDNLFFGRDDVAGGPLITAIDWQIVLRGPAAFDVAYFLTGNLRESDAAAEKDLVGAYHAELSGLGVSLPFAELDHAYQLSKVAILYRIVTGVDEMDFGDARGVELIETWIDRLGALFPTRFEELLR